MRFMRSFKAGLALALAASVVLGPLQTLQAAGPGKGFLSGEARAEAKRPYSDYAVRARNVADGTIAATTVLDTQGNFKLDGLPAGKMMVELTKVGQNKVICSEGPFDLKSGPDVRAGLRQGQDRHRLQHARVAVAVAGGGRSGWYHGRRGGDGRTGRSDWQHARVGR